MGGGGNDPGNPGRGPVAGTGTSIGAPGIEGAIPGAGIGMVKASEKLIRIWRQRTDRLHVSLSVWRRRLPTPSNLTPSACL